MNDEKSLGRLRYSGRLVDGGYMDSRHCLEYLSSLTNLPLSLLFHDNSNLADSDFEIPVTIKRGSWDIIIPEAANLALIYGGLAIVTGMGIYTSAAISTIAANDFKNASTKDFFRSALKNIQWIIKIGKHLGTIEKKIFPSVKWRNDNTEIGIPNEKGEYLYAPRKIIELFQDLPSDILGKVSGLIEEERTMFVGVMEDGKWVEEKITYKEKHIFSVSKKEDEVLFPELSHGMYAELEGYVTRGNTNSNSLGLEYKGHILNFVPRAGNIVKHKEVLFTKSRIIGEIDRTDDDGNTRAKKPAIIFTEIVSLEAPGNEEQSLFVE